MKRLWTLLVLVVLLAGLVPAALAQGPVGTPPTGNTSLGVDPGITKVPDNAGASAAPEAPWPGPDGFGYAGSTVPYSWIDISASGTLVAGYTSCDDGYAGPFNIGFTFPFYGVNYTQWMAESNGFIDLGTTGSGSLGNQCPLPNATTPNNIIAQVWDDMNLCSAGQVRYQTFASCPTGPAVPCMVVAYLAVPYYSGGGTATGETIIYANGEIRQQFQTYSEGGSSSTTGIEGNNFGANHGLTYACNTASSIPASTAIRYSIAPYIDLAPALDFQDGCTGQEQQRVLALTNRSGVNPETINLTYAIQGPGNAGGPASRVVANGVTVPVTVTWRLDACLQPSQTMTVTVNAVGVTSGLTDTARIVRHSVFGATFWQQITSEPDTGRMDHAVGAYNGYVWDVTGYGANTNVRRYDPVANTWTSIVPTGATPPNNYARSGCTHGNTIYVYGDAVPSFTGLRSYNFDTNTWTALTPGGTPPAQTGIWAPAWVHDPETGYCYLTGGATAPGAGNLTTVYVYDPATNAWLTQLPNFTSIRDFHAAWIFVKPADGHKLLCVGGGNNGLEISSTQCYDFATAAWNAENADMGALPEGLWGMGYASKVHLGTDPQMWVMDGVNASGSAIATTRYYDVNSNTWQVGGNTPSGATYRTSATTLNNEVYKIAGSTGGFTYSGLSDRHIQLVCPPSANLQPFKLAPALARPGDVISYTIVMNSDNPLEPGQVMADPLPAGVVYADNLTWTAGLAWYSPTVNTVFWTMPYGLYAQGHPAEPVPPTTYIPEGPALAGRLSDYDAASYQPNAPGEVHVPTSPARYRGVDALVYYSDRGTFDTDFPGLPLEGFEAGNVAPGSIAVCPSPLDSTSNNACFTPGQIQPGIQFATSGSYPSDGLALLGAGFMGNPSKNVVANYFVESYNITFTTVVHAAGMDLVSYASEGTVDITIYGPGGVVLGTTTAPATNAGTFWGVSSDQPITRININSEGGQAEGVDNVAFGFVAIAPPMITFDVTVTAPCNTTVVNEGVAMCGNVTAPFAAATDIWGEADIEVIAPPLWAELCPTSTEVITFTICNVGDCDLNWELHEMTPTLVLAGSMPFVPVNVAGQGLNPGLTAASPQVQPVAVPAASPHDVLWDQPLSTANQGAYVNQEFPDVPTFSSFLADDFVNADGWIINSIFIPGDGWNGFSTLLNATGLTWQIYADNAGVPDGDPSGGGNPPVWTLTLPPNDPQVVLTNGTPGGMPSNAQLNLAAPVNLPVGHWWLVFYPTLNFSGGGQYGRQPADTTNGYTGQFINPGGGFGYGTVWQAWTILGPTQTDIAFRIEGTIVIPYPDFPWVSESPLTGTLPPGGCTVVDVTFDSTGYPPGNYFADLLIVSNDPIEPEITLPMTMTVDTPAYINDVTTGINGLTVAFTSTVVGTPPISYMWDFGDGNTSTDPNPIHTYAAGGCYTYTLNIANGCGTDNWAGQVCVCDPVHDADFTWNPPTPIVGEVAYFTATAAGTGPITYDWAFGDSATGTGQYVNHAYAAAGTYTVVMTATGECGFQVVSHDVTVASGCVAPDGADFTWVPITPTAGANVDFSGSVMTGTSPLTFDWQFSDGGTASGQNVTHVFANPGTYVVTMTVSNGCGDDTMVHTVVVAGVCEPVSNTAFTWSPPSPLVGENVTFNATADGSPVIVFAWAFGDGATDSGATVVHAYAAEGSYDVVVTATNGCGEETVLHTVTVVSGCVAPAGADFTWLPPNPVVGQAVSFHGTLGAGTSPLFYTWTFGDGSGASGSLTPSYIYATAGTFTVTLTVTNTCGTADVSHPITVQPVVTGYFIYLPLVYKAATP